MTRAFAQYPFVPAHHPPDLPELRDGMDPRRHSVVIAGGGIAGLVSALGLAKCGVRSVVLEADDSVCFGSRAVCLSRRSLEILARFGALDPILAKSLPWAGGRSFYRDGEVLQFHMPHDENQRLPPMVNLQQFYIEQFLIEAVQATGLVEVRWQNRVLDITAMSDGAILEVDTPAGRYSVATDWLLGCDGARSPTRESTGLKLSGTSYEGRYVIVDLLLRSERPTERLAWFDPPSNPGSTILMHRQPDDIWRIDYQLCDGEDPEQAVRVENVIPRVESHLRMIGEREDWLPIWISLYKANALTLHQYHEGRVLLAGDAAHLVPIFGVRGANSAIEDADNLSWKLALVIKGAAGAALLESYSSERVRAAHENLRQAAKSTEFMSPPSFGFDLMRTAVLGLAHQHSFVRRLINPRQTEPSSYADSPLTIPCEGAGQLPGPLPGHVLRECPVTLVEPQGARSGYITELLSSCFTALCFTDDGRLPREFTEIEQSMRAARMELRVVALSGEYPSHASSPVAWDHTGRLFPMYGAEAGTVYLVRPDGYILTRWQRATGENIRRSIQQCLKALQASASG